MNEPLYVVEAKNMSGAVRQRMHLGFEAVANIFHLVEEYGLPVVRRDMKEDGPDGMYANNGEIAIAVINTSRPRTRQRFTAAHELGHHVFDYGVGLQIDENIFDQRDIREKKANAFAAHFLMPEDGIRNLVSKERRKLTVTPQDIVHLRHHFGVSSEAIIYQVHNISFITAAERNKFLEMNKDGTLKSIEWESGYLPKAESHHEKLHRLPTDYVKRAIRSYVSGKISLNRLAELLEWSEVQSLKDQLDAAKIWPVGANMDEYREDVEQA
ncbi:MAG: ImmA/IrrE family metallo-endopeptidase [Thermoleophilia bacterium]